MFYKIVALKNFAKYSQKNTYCRDSFLVRLQAFTCNFVKKETRVQVL